jgi:AhpD family alkylhydroperoxidase
MTMGTLLIKATRRISPAHIKYVQPVPPSAAPALVARVYAQVEADFGMLAPPVALHAAAPGVLAACWSILRETLLASGHAARDSKEAVAAAVSLANRCPYCVDVHGAALVGLHHGPDAALIAAGHIDQVADPELRALAQWARASGTPDRPPVPFPSAQTAELVGVALTFHYINRMVSVFLRESPLPDAPGPARAMVRRLAQRIMGGLGRVHIRAGASLDLLPDATLPDDLSWAAPAPHIAGALARGSAAIAEAGERAVPGRVRDLVMARLEDPDAERPGLGARAWLDAAMTALPDEERAAGRLALLTAFAAYQVTPDLVDDYRRSQPDDATLVELAGWASFAAARRVARDLGHDVELAAHGR